MPLTLEKSALENERPRYLANAEPSRTGCLRGEGVTHPSCSTNASTTCGLRHGVDSQANKRDGERVATRRPSRVKGSASPQQSLPRTVD